MKNIYSYLWIAPLFILLQVLFLNNIQFVSYINPLVYLILIITLPQDTDRWFLIIYAFYLGILLDLFEGNIGLNTSALVFISFLKPYLNKVLIPQKSIEGKDKLGLKNLGIQTFSLYALAIIFIHNSFLFLLENFSFASILLLLLQVLLSTIVTFIVILIFQLFTFKTKE